MSRLVERAWRTVAPLAIVGCLGAGCASMTVETYDTPDDAIRGFVDAMESGDRQRAEALFGAEALTSILSGDPVADREDARRVKEMILEQVALEDAGENEKVALLGADQWPFPIPIVREGGRWRLDVEAGREEILNRRVGRNELLTLATLRAYVEAQREYTAEGRDGEPPAFARRFISSPGLHDGLWWPVDAGEPESPLGPLAAQAAAEGYDRTDEPSPYHGYWYRILHGQESSAPGGEKSYLDASGLLTGGFAAMAWPARYGNSGIMTFIVNQQGIVFEKDLGEETEAAAKAIMAYDPDATWEPTGD